jgi:hypothetical protein
MEAPQNRNILWKIEFLPPLAHLYKWEEDDFGQNIWDRSEVLLGTPLGNNLGTISEQRKNEKTFLPHPTQNF